MINPRGSSSDAVAVLGVRESNLYRLKGEPMRTMASTRVTENKEQTNSKVEKLKGSQPSKSKGKEQLSKKMSWYEMAIQDAQEQEASRSKLKGKSSTQGPAESVRIDSLS